jgi:hypothetical protein
VNNSAAINLVAGQKYDIKMEYYDRAGGAVALLQWSHPGQSLQLIPANRLLSPVGSTGLTAVSSKAVQADLSQRVVVSPNPATSTDILTARVFSDYATEATLSLVSMNGRVAFSRKIILQQGQNTTKIPARLLSTGTYILTVDDGKKQTVKKVFVSP